MIPPDAWIPLAEVARPHGVRGELRLKLFNTDSDVLLERDEVLVRMKDGAEHEVSVDRARRADDAILMKLFSVDDRDRADELRGAFICARRRDFPELEDGEFYMCDAEGARVVAPAAALVVSAEAGTEGEPAPVAAPAAEPDGGLVEVGTVKAIRNYPTVDALVVKAADGGMDWEIPLVDAFVEAMDLAAGTITLKTLEGLERS